MAQQKPNETDSEPRCIFGCKKYRTLRTVPINNSCREDWRKLLNLRVLRAQHKVCDQHFQNGTAEFNLPIDTKTPRYKKCVLRCRSYARLHKVPDDDELLEKWRQRLKVKTLLKSHRVCSNHFKKARTKFIRTRELPDSPEPSDDDNETLESKKTPNPDHERTKKVTQNNNKQERHIEVWLMDALASPMSAGDEVSLHGVNNEKEGNSDESLDDETLNKYMEIVGNATTDSESGSFSLNWGVLGEEIEANPRSIVPNSEDTEDYDSSSNMIVQTDDNDLSPEDYPSKRVTLTIERLDTSSLEQNDEETSDDTKEQTNENENDSLDSEGLEGQFRAIDNDSLIVDELEGRSSRMRNSLNAPIYAPSRSHALQSWLNTPDFCIVTKTRKS